MVDPSLDEEAEAKRTARAAARAQADADSQQFLQRFASFSERGMALSITAYLDVKVKRFISHCWIDDKSTRDNMLRVEGGPLAGLRAKINLCYLMGYIKRRTFDDLTAISAIRNEFAHTLEAETFSFPKISGLCKSLLIFEDASLFFGAGDEEEAKHQLKFYDDFKYDLKDGRYGFMAATGFLANKFQTTQHRPHNMISNFIRPLF